MIESVQSSHSLNTPGKVADFTAHFQRLLVTNTPVSVQALIKRQNRTRAMQTRNIVIQLFLDDQGTSYGELSVKHWEVFTGGECGCHADFSEALVYNSDQSQESRSSIAVGGNCQHYWDTTYARSARCIALREKLGQVFHGSPASKELTFVVFREITSPDKLHPYDRQLA
ncbi:hypothetical protein ACHAPK_010987, partial [Fusarium culmorum]